MTRSTNNKWLTVYAVFTAGCTLLLIGAGGLVTSHGAGMAVPDWPTTYGYNMFMFPISQWVGGIFYEHTHRLIASGVGLLTLILMVSLWLKESRSWMRWLGLAAFLAVVAQGVLGGLRVTLYKDQLGIFHAALAQLFFVLVSSIALFSTKWWQSYSPKRVETPLFLKPAVLALTIVIFAQLVIGATMRHQHAGLAVPDFPLAYGQLWPRTDPAFIEWVNARRLDYREFQPITAFQIYLHMVHRIVALLIFVGTAFCAFKLRRTAGVAKPVLRLTTGWFGLICLQALLGIYTVLSNKAADIATAHVVVGALNLLLGSVIYMVSAKVAPRLARAEGLVEISHSNKELKSATAAG